MPGNDWNEVRDQIALGRALDAFEAHVDREATLGGLLLSEPLFSVRDGEVGLLTPQERVVVVEVNGESGGRALRAGPLREGPFEARVRNTTDTAGAARTLGMSETEAEQLLSHLEQAVRAGITAYGQATEAFDREQQRLTCNMNALNDGLERIVRVYSEHVHLEYEDPETFGVGTTCCIRSRTATPASRSRNATRAPTGPTLIVCRLPGHGVLNARHGEQTALMDGASPRAAQSIRTTRRRCSGRPRSGRSEPATLPSTPYRFGVMRQVAHRRTHPACDPNGSNGPVGASKPRSSLVASGLTSAT